MRPERRFKGRNGTGRPSIAALKTSNPRPRRTLAYCGRKMVLTMGTTLLYEVQSPLLRAIITRRHASRRGLHHPERRVLVASEPGAVSSARLRLHATAHS